MARSGENFLGPLPGVTSEMHAVVLLKEILDWELPADTFRIDAELNRPRADVGSTLLGPFEQNALELALQLKDAGVVTRLTAMSAAPTGEVGGLRKALALRSDDAVHVISDGADDADASQTAALLTAALGRLAPVDLVVAGRQAGDWDNGQVGYLVAERLGLPCVSLVFHAEEHDGRLRVWRLGTDGVEQLAVSPPALLTVTSDPSLKLRLGSVMDRMAANKKPITTWTADELRVDIAGSRRLTIDRVWVPQVDRKCETVEGDDPAEVARAVLARLGELNLLSVEA